MSRTRHRSKTRISRLEAKFEFYWRGLGGPELKREFVFHPERKWRADFAHIESRTLIEIEGGVFINGGGRHNRAAGFIADAEKYLHASVTRMPRANLPTVAWRGELPRRREKTSAATPPDEEKKKNISLVPPRAQSSQKNNQNKTKEKKRKKKTKKKKKEAKTSRGNAEGEFQQESLEEFPPPLPVRVGSKWVILSPTKIGWFCKA